LAKPRAAVGARIETIAADPAGGTRIEGVASPGTAVFLFAEGRLVATAFAESGHFRFENVRAAAPYRVRALPPSVAPTIPLGTPPPGRGPGGGRADASNHRAAHSQPRTATALAARPAPRSRRSPRDRVVLRRRILRPRRKGHSRCAPISRNP